MEPGEQELNSVVYEKSPLTHRKGQAANKCNSDDFCGVA